MAKSNLLNCVKECFSPPDDHPEYEPSKIDPEIPGPRQPDPSLPDVGDPPNLPPPLRDPPPIAPEPTPAQKPPVKLVFDSKPAFATMASFGDSV